MKLVIYAFVFVTGGLSVSTIVTAQNLETPHTMAKHHCAASLE